MGPRRALVSLLIANLLLIASPLPAFTLPGFTLPGFTLPGFTLPGFTLPGFTLPGHTLPGFTLPGSALVGVGTPAVAAPRWEPGEDIVALWPMNETAGSERMVDSSGNGLHGRIGDEVGTGLTLDGDVGYRFERLEPDTPPARPGHLVVVPDDSLLDPGDADYVVTVRLRTTNKFGNIIQKGQATVAGGNFKIQIPNGRVECTFRGASAFLEVIAPSPINDGDWHVVQCARVRAGVLLMIDGTRVAARTGWTGTIANSWPVSIGGKLECDQRDVGCDYYAGDLDYIAIEAAHSGW